MRHRHVLVLAALFASCPVVASAQDAPVVATVADVGGNAATPATSISPATTDGDAAPADATTAASAAGDTTAVAPGRPLRMPSMASLVTSLRGDLRQTASVDNAVIMLTASASAALIHPYDYRITEYFSSSPTLATVLGPGKVLGGFAVQFGGAWVTYGIGRALKHERAAVVGADLVRAQLVNTVFTQGLKLSVNRTRPDGTDWSFPSGHASGTFANAAVLHRHFGWKVGAPAYAVATYVAASRLQANRHFASDVIFGAGVGLISGRAVTVGRGAQRFAVGPMAVPGGGAGISFTRID
ncbi:hypothetical protein TBR22_A13630 [Luteitalea sp. TBR-22]|uniref:phosphatase PAP2 family protein n=1 Tax=Luteitalea sp. TBR-22 TaxID=2802971 RepID=UPI001AF9028F|nr:phosphatase PAP2 family protein [Luteitalea sp. TBR-22]BCS32153.1 hypothetical protein TBR22_A13630 [Luteitalea sp. TBR-22]